MLQCMQQSLLSQTGLPADPQPRLLLWQQQLQQGLPIQQTGECEEWRRGSARL